MVSTSSGSSPASYAATRQRSTKRRLGAGSASEQTITIWSALATMIRSSGSVSSADRRSALVRGSTRTIRASVPSAPDVSPASATRSPTTTEPLPSSRAFMATTSPPSVMHPYRPRSTLVTKPSTALECAGRRRVRGRELRPGRTRTSSSSSRA